MRPLKVFVSYAHINSPVKIALEGTLKAAGFEVRTDTDGLNTEDLRRAISANINWSDVFVPIVTTQWLTSEECREEGIRAHERRRPIVIFRHQSVTDDGPPIVPWYLRGSHYLHVAWRDDQLQGALENLVRRLQADIVPDSWQSACYKLVRELGDSVQKAQPAWEWQTTLAERILDTARSQLSKVLASTECALSVSHDYAYLRFAQPIFSDATTIVAVCIAGISTFWISPDTSSAAGSYLSEQKEADSICRLFVFESVSELMRFRPILAKHHRSYGEQSDSNGVFICSVGTYRQLLQGWGMDHDEGALHHDFGILSFGNQNAKGMYATLNNREFRYTMYDENDHFYVSNRRVIDHFARLRRLTVGAFDESGVARWSPEWAESEESLAAPLERLFSDRRQTVTHVVLLRPKEDSPALFHRLQELASYFHKHRSALKINSVSLKRRCDVAVTDGRYASPLLIWQDFDYLLILELDDSEALKYYYQHELHSEEREKIYSLLNPAMEARFAEARHLAPARLQERAAVFSGIESEMTAGGYIRRIDVRSDDPLRFLLFRLT